MSRQEVAEVVNAYLRATYGTRTRSTQHQQPFLADTHMHLNSQINALVRARD